MGDAEGQGPIADPDAPLTFGWGTVAGGAFRAWLLFFALLLAAVIVYVLASMFPLQDLGSLYSAAVLGGTVLGWSAVVGGGVSLVVMALGIAPAWLIARAVRRVGSVTVHVAVWALVGALVGASVVGAKAALDGSTFLLTTPALPLTAGATAVSVVYGWWRASRHARRQLRERDPRSPLGLESAFGED